MAVVSSWPRGVALSCPTNAIHAVHQARPCRCVARLRGLGPPLAGWWQAQPRQPPALWQKSSQYGLYRLGYTRVTRARTKGCGGEGQS